MSEAIEQLEKSPRESFLEGYQFGLVRLEATSPVHYMDLETEVAINLIDSYDGVVDCDQAFRQGAWHAVSEVTINPLSVVRQRIGRELVGGNRR